jgi:hypothetical protein
LPSCLFARDSRQANKQILRSSGAAYDMVHRRARYPDQTLRSLHRRIPAYRTSQRRLQIPPKLLSGTFHGPTSAGPAAGARSRIAAPPSCASAFASARSYSSSSSAWDIPSRRSTRQRSPSLIRYSSRMPVSLSAAHALYAPADLHQALETRTPSGEQVMHSCNSRQPNADQH